RVKVLLAGIDVAHDFQQQRVLVGQAYRLLEFVGGQVLLALFQQGTARLQVVERRVGLQLGGLHEGQAGADALGCLFVAAGGLGVNVLGQGRLRVGLGGLL